MMTFNKPILTQLPFCANEYAVFCGFVEFTMRHPAVRVVTYTCHYAFLVVLAIKY